MKSLHYEFLLGRSTVAEIIEETCKGIWKCLISECLEPPTVEDWEEIANNFEKRSNFPNCVGALDGKHIRIINPWNSGSEFFCHKQFFSIVLMAVVDSDYCFRVIDVGGYGHECDSNIFKGTQFGKTLYNGTLNLPQARPLPNEPKNDPLPFVFLADEGFGLDTNLMKPYPRKGLTYEKKVFNYRLSRGRRIVECAFGILANKWRIFHRAIDVNINLATLITKTCCVLHNFVRRRDGYKFDDTLTCPLQDIQNQGVRGSDRGIDVRDKFCSYFNSVGAVPWQNAYIVAKDN